jgi:hypothetical protein
MALRSESQSVTAPAGQRDFAQSRSTFLCAENGAIWMSCTP